MSLVILGAQWGDEGKGKIVDYLSLDAKLVCRPQGGDNAGHTVIVDKVTYALHLLPSGILNPFCKVFIGNGVVINILSFIDEIEKIKLAGIPNVNERIMISNRAHIVFTSHRIMDSLMEKKRGELVIGTTGKGIGPTYSTKSQRINLRVCDLMEDFDTFSNKLKKFLQIHEEMYKENKTDIDSEIELYRKYREILKPMVINSFGIVHKTLENKEKVVIEMANGCFLDIDFGTYPYVTSCNTTIGSALTGLGISVKQIGHIIGVTKAYTTRVGVGPLPTEIHGDLSKYFIEKGHEYGTTTGRQRRVGWLDIVILKTSAILNGYTHLALTKIDILDELDEILLGVKYFDKDRNDLSYIPASLAELEKVTVEYQKFEGWKCSTSGIKEYNKLPRNTQIYIEAIEKLVNIPIALIGTGRDRNSIIDRSIIN